MGFFDFLKPKQKVNVSITTHESTKDEIAKQYAGYCKAQAEKRHAEQEDRANVYFLELSADDIADKNGLKPTEILMLSYLEKYSINYTWEQFRLPKNVVIYDILCMSFW